MKNITVISGSQLGSSEYVAEHLAQILVTEGFTSQIFHGPQLAELPLSGIWLIVTSTYGAGELPDNLQPLFNQIEQQRTDLSSVTFGAIGLGNTQYDLFCGAIKKVNDTLLQMGAKRIGNILEIDVTEHQLPEDPAEIWLNQWIPQIK